MENKMNKVTYCVVCSYITDNGMSVCTECAMMCGISVDYVPTVCGDNLCFLDEQGQPNFDGDCNHFAHYANIVCDMA